MRLTKEEEEQFRDELAGRLADLRRRFEGQVMDSQQRTIAEVKGCLQEIIAWVNSVAPPREYNVRIVPRVRVDGVHFDVSVDPIPKEWDALYPPIEDITYP
jgi:hypothetical protein